MSQHADCVATGFLVSFAVSVICLFSGIAVEGCNLKDRAIKAQAGYYSPKNGIFKFNGEEKSTETLRFVDGDIKGCECPKKFSEFFKD